MRLAIPRYQPQQAAPLVRYESVRQPQQSPPLLPEAAGVLTKTASFGRGSASYVITNVRPGTWVLRGDAKRSLRIAFRAATRGSGFCYNAARRAFTIVTGGVRRWPSAGEV